MTNQPKRRKWEFTIQRSDHLERTIIGVDGRTHVLRATRHGTDGHFNNEGQYRRAIEDKVKLNSR